MDLAFGAKPVSPEQQRANQRQSSQPPGRKSKELPLWQKILWAIPKNLVYVFGLVIIFAFLGMLYVTYTDTNIDQFLNYDRTQVKVQVAPVYQHLRLTMNLDRHKVPEQKWETFNSKILSTKYLNENRPVVLRGMAKEWQATQKWDLDYLNDKCGSTTSMVSAFFRRNDTIEWNKVAPAAMIYPQPFSQAIEQIQNNDVSIHAATMTQKLRDSGESDHDGLPRSALFFLNDDLVRCTSDLRQDYSFPPLHDFLRFQKLGLSILPVELGSLTPSRGENSEKFVCKVNQGSIKLRMMSPVFNQNLYLGVYEDLLSEELPEFLDIFDIDAKTFPLLHEVEDHILETTLNQGDCVYVPQFWWQANKAEENMAILVSFGYEGSSKLTELLFDALLQGHGEEKLSF